MEESGRAASPRMGATLVAAGILLSRITGFVRQYIFAHFFGNGAAADAFNAALKIPNLLQNLFGEGVLSASFIPVYAGLLGRGDDAEASRVAGVVATLLAMLTTVLVVLGMLATPVLIVLIAPGFSGEKREVTIRLVRILFPGVGLLVLSSWCLGILNSHRRFFLSYAAPVVWSAAMIVAMLIFGGTAVPYSLAAIVALAATIGSALQLAVQLPVVLALLGRLRLSLDVASRHVREVFRNFGPVVLSRGVVQISAYIDQILASLLPTGAVAGLAYAQLISTLPVSLFGMAISASELPEMARATGDPEEVAAELRARLTSGVRRIAFLVVPSAVALAALGDVMAALLYQSGRFTHDDAVYVWAILAGASVGLLASTMGRLYSSTFYALRDTRTPLRFAVVRVVLTTALGWLFAITLPPAIGIAPRWGTAGLTTSAGISAWVELALLRGALRRRIGATRRDRTLARAAVGGRDRCRRRCLGREARDRAGASGDRRRPGPRDLRRDVPRGGGRAPRARGEEQRRRDGPPRPGAARAAAVTVPAMTDRTGTPLVSVVMPLYNSARHLDESVASILAQSFGDFELVIVDDASTDGSLAAARAWAARDARVRVVAHREHAGVAENGNRAVRAARAAVCARMDADDVSLPDRLRAEWDVLRRRADVVLVGALGDGIDAAGRTVRSRDRWLLLRRSPFAPFAHGSIMFRRDLFLALGGYREPCRVWSDLDLYYRMADRGRIVVLPERLYRHRFHLDSVSTQATAGTLAATFAAMERSLERRRRDRSYAVAAALAVSNGSGRGAPITARALHSLASRRLWAGHSPGILRVLLATPAPVDAMLARALLVGVFGAVSPRGFRLLLRAGVRARDLAAAALVPRGTPVEWPAP